MNINDMQMSKNLKSVANSVDPDQKLCPVASNMGLYFLLRTVHLNTQDNIGIKHGFSCINIRQVPWEVLKTEAEGRGFQHLPRDLANVNAFKNSCSIAIIV